MIDKFIIRGGYMNLSAYELLIGISKHIITLSTAITAGLISFITILHGKSIDIFYAEISISASAIAIISSILIQVSITSKLMEEKSCIPDDPKIFYAVSWFTFLLSGMFAGFFLISNI